MMFKIFKKHNHSKWNRTLLFSSVLDWVEILGYDFKNKRKAILTDFDKI